MAVLSAMPSAATAEYLIPPGNSAATQYTEAIPTGGGNSDAGKGSGHSASPAEALGARKARQLEARGEAGRALAALATETAPSASATYAAGGGNTTAPNRSASAPKSATSNSGAVGPKAGEPTPQSSGGSGLGEVVAQATGSSSSGQMGPLLPFLIAVTIAWSIAYLLRTRKRSGQVPV